MNEYLFWSLFPLTGLNAGTTSLDTSAVANSQQVCSPKVVSRKGRPPSLRRASRMETDMRKAKAKQKKPLARGKCKQVWILIVIFFGFFFFFLPHESESP